MDRPFASVEETDEFQASEAEADTLPPEAPDTLRPVTSDVFDSPYEMSFASPDTIEAFLQAQRAREDNELVTRVGRVV